MMTFQEIRDALQDRKLSKVAEATGLHYNTVRDVCSNPDSNPTKKTLEALSQYLEPRK